MGPTFEERCRAVRDNPAARRAAWESGQLWWLLHSLQFSMWSLFYRATDDVVLDVARRIGKTFLLLVLACETALRLPNASIKYAAQTAKDVRKMIRPNLRKVLATCPEDIKPRIDWHNGEIAFPNGSVIDIAGCDNGNYEHLRGQEAHLWIVDEGGFIDELETVVESVLDPQTWTTKGRGIIASTPPDSPGHPFRTYYLAAKGNGTSARHTFWENPQISDDDKRRIVEKGARRRRMTVPDYLKTTQWRREGLAEFVTEETRAVLPEFTEELAEALTCDETSTPLFADWYTIIDLGGSRDPTAILVGYWDFGRRKFRCQRNRVLQRPTTEAISKAAKELEAATFSQMPALRGKHFRIMDDDQGVVRRDLAQKYSFVTIAPLKDDKDAALMDLRDCLLRGEIEFDPECRETLAQCQAAIWNKGHTEYERVEGFGHFDLLDTLLYASRNFIPNKGRVPALYGVDRANTIIRPRAPEMSQASRALQQIFGGGR